MNIFKKLFGKPISNVNEDPPASPRPEVASQTVKTEEYGLPPLKAPPPEKDTRQIGAPYYDNDTQTYYIKVQVDDHYEWHVDQERMNKIAAEQAAKDAETKYKQELATALQTRIITDEEMLKVMKYDIGLFIAEPFYSISGYGGTQYCYGGQYITSQTYHDKLNYLQRTFNEAILQQFKLRTVKHAVKSKEIVQSVKKEIMESFQIKKPNEKTGKPTKRKSLSPYGKG